jgi:hypothetical protein
MFQTKIPLTNISQSQPFINHDCQTYICGFLGSDTRHRAGNMSEMEILRKLETGVGSELDAALQQLLDTTRRPEEQDWSTILGKEGIAIIGRGAFGMPSASPVTRHLALRCLNNILYRSQRTRQLFVNADFPQALIGLMKVCPLVP